MKRQQKKQRKQEKLQKKRDKKRKGRSTQELLDFRGFTRYGLQTGRYELIYYEVSPINISVLSRENISVKIHHLIMTLSALPDIEIVCHDSSESFDDNKLHIRTLLCQEQNVKVQQALEKDLHHLDEIQMGASAARQFLFITRVRFEREDQRLQHVGRVEKAIAEQGFEVRRLEKDDLKRILAIHFEASLQGNRIGDVDGIQFFDLEGQHATF